MAYNTVSIRKDVDGKPIPQYYNPLKNQYEVAEGFEGTTKILLCNEDGVQIGTQVLNSMNLINNKLDELIGVMK